MEEKALRARIADLQRQLSSGGPIEPTYRGALTAAIAVYGPESPHVQDLRAAGPVALNFTKGAITAEAIRGTLENIEAEIEAGVVGTLRGRISGEILADLTSLAREVLADNESDGNTNVAAVLAAAAFEDTIRRMGELLAGVTDRRKLSKVVDALGNAKVLHGSDLRLANNNHLTFRNDALHADWAKISRPTIESVIAFVEGLLAKHFP